MNKVFIVVVRCYNDGDLRWRGIEKVCKSIDTARARIEEIKNEYRSDEDIEILGENWSAGEWPFYNVRAIEKYYIKHGMLDKVNEIECEIEEHELVG